MKVDAESVAAFREKQKAAYAAEVARWEAAGLMGSSGAEEAANDELAASVLARGRRCHCGPLTRAAGPQLGARIVCRRCRHDGRRLGYVRAPGRAGVCARTHCAQALARAPSLSRPPWQVACGRWAGTAAAAVAL